MPPQEPRIPLMFPVKGLVESPSYSRQSVDTSSDLLNVRTYEAIKGRARGGRREGLSKFFATGINGTSPIQAMRQVTSSFTAAVGEQYVACGNGVTGNVRAEVRRMKSDGVRQFFFNTPDTADVFGAAWDGSGTYICTEIEITEAGFDSGNPHTVFKLQDFETGSTGGCEEADFASAILWAFNTNLKAREIVYDPLTQRVYVCGEAGTGWDGAGGKTANVWALDSVDGSLVWSFDTGLPEANHVTLDSSGNIYVMSGTGGATSDAKITKITPAGVSSATYTTNVVVDFEFDDLDYDLANDKILVVHTNPGTTWTGNDSSSKNIFTLTSDLDLDTTRLLTSTSDGLSGKWYKETGDYILLDRTTVGTTSNIRRYTLAGVTVWSGPADYECGTNQTHMAVQSGEAVGICITGLASTGWDGTGDTVTFMRISGTDGLRIEHLDDSASNVSNGYFRQPAVGVLSSNLRSEALIVVAGGEARRISSGVISTPTNAATNNMTAARFLVQMDFLGNVMFMVDGDNSRLYDFATDTIQDWATEVTGSGSGSLQANCRLAVRYRGRACIAAPKSDPHNWFFSAVGNHLDFNFSPSTTTATQAVAGNNSETGLLGDSITAMCPISDDVLVFGCDHSIWQMAGDPAAGGSIDLISDKTGMIWNAWTKSPEGVLYFLGVDGIYRMTEDNLPLKISEDRIDERIKALDFATSNALLEWDYLTRELKVVVVSALETVATVFTWESRVDAWQIDEYPATMGPTVIYALDAERQDDKRLLLGGQDGIIRMSDASAVDDDGTSISSNARFAPVSSNYGDVEVLFTDFSITLAEGSGDVQLKVYSGQTAEQCAISTVPRLTRTLKAGRNRFTSRVRGAWVQIDLSQTSASTRWALEEAHVGIRRLGKTRMLRR